MRSRSGNEAVSSSAGAAEDRFLFVVEQKRLFDTETAYAGAFQVHARPDERVGGKWRDPTYRQLLR